MRQINAARLEASHQDYSVISEITAELMARAGGMEKFRGEFPLLVRAAIDELIDTLRTGRIHARELEKTEKTYAGTKIEIIVRNFFRLPRGILDLRIRDLDVDVKYTFFSDWMLPPEVIGKPCILIASDETQRTCFFGIFIARLEYLRVGGNRDKKTSISAAGRANIHWILNGEAYPPGFWSSIGADRSEQIMDGSSGTERMRRLFRLVQERPIHRDIIAAVGQQKDPMKRIRKNGGARDHLAAEGIAVLTGKYDAGLIRQLGLPFCDGDHAISYQPLLDTHIRLLQENKKIF